MRLIRGWIFKRRVRKAFKFLKLIDESLRVHPHWKRKQFWKDFIKSDKFRSYSLRHFPGVFEGKD